MFAAAFARWPAAIALLLRWGRAPLARPVPSRDLKLQMASMWAGRIASCKPVAAFGTAYKQ